MADAEKLRKETIRQMKIKHGVVKRLQDFQEEQHELNQKLEGLHKEYFHYEQEAVKEGERLQKMKDGGKDEYELRKQQEIIDESNMMLPDTKRKFMAAYNDLESFLTGAAEYSEAEEYTQAKELLDTTKGLKG